MPWSQIDIKSALRKAWTGNGSRDSTVEVAVFRRIEEKTEVEWRLSAF
ncbi:Uncharacterized protein AC507_4506 [Pseudomonas syringae pv. maculicola]|nr:Uncharacterized protein AC507_4506 [Pseudomonas syringae pv. maculicola]